MRREMNHQICFFGDYWDDMWRRRQQLACRLAQTDWVTNLVYIERPLPITSLIKFSLGQADLDGTARWRRVLGNHSWVMSIGEKLSVLTASAPLPPVNSKLIFQASEWLRDRWLLKRLKKYFHVKRPLVWISHPQVSVEVIKSFEPLILWYDCTEDFSAWPGLPAPVIEQIRSTDIWLTEHADVVTTVSRTLYNEKSKLNMRTYWLPNAVDIGLFMQPKENPPMPKELQDIQRPILTFVGGMSDWAHDWDLLDQVAALRQNWTIILIGELSITSRTAKMLKAHGNILCLGQKPYSELPNYLANSDICFRK